MYFTDPGPGWTRHLAGVRERLKPSGRPAQVSQHRPQLAGHSVPSPTHPWETSGTTQRHRDRSQARHRLRDTPACRAGTLVTLSASQKPFRPFLVNDRGPGALQKKDTARGRPTTDRHRWLARSLARSLVQPPRRLHLLWRDSVLPRSRPEVARAHNRTGNSPVGSPTPPHPTREHGERGPGWTFGATKTKVRPRPQAARKTGENNRSLARSLTENKDR